MRSIPEDDFTPHGYLHVPGHTRNLSVKGVVRSHEAGFRFHVPAYAGMYGGRRETYRAGMSISLGGAITIGELDNVGSRVHTKNRIDMNVEHRGMRVRSEWMLVNDDVMTGMFQKEGNGDFAVLLEYERCVSANGEWGESGLVGRVAGNDVIIQSFEDGDAFVFASSNAVQSVNFTSSLDEAMDWIRSPLSMSPIGESEWVNVLGSRGDLVQLYAVVTFDVPSDFDVRLWLARGHTLPEACSRLRVAIASTDEYRQTKQLEDERFWSTAPRLFGDWPDHWRRGLVYDLETLRMMVMRPSGIYRHIWDGMQIQAPRLVLAEAAIDILLLSYADPALARELMAGIFLDAPIANVPCSREDGSYNMVSARGEVCGTGPQWGYPWFVVEWLWDQHPDLEWMERLYPRMSSYLDWWMMNRSTPDGWLWFECSWESGQDGSPRFGDQPLGGGHPTPHIRPVDLHASIAHAATVMRRLSSALDLQLDVKKWEAVACDHTQRTKSLWNGERFADFDVNQEAFSDVMDVMQLSAIQFGVADDVQIDVSREQIRSYHHDQLHWPMFAWTAVEAAMVSGETDHAITTAAGICDRAWSLWDARTQEPGKTLPGIACEFWPLNGRCGGEGYGWGAFQIHLLFHTLLGFTPTPHGLKIAPNLPPDFRRPGTQYGVSLTYGGQDIDLLIVPSDDKDVRVVVHSEEHYLRWGDSLQIPIQS